MTCLINGIRPHKPPGRRPPPFWDPPPQTPRGWDHVLGRVVTPPAPARSPASSSTKPVATVVVSRSAPALSSADLPLAKPKHFLGPNWRQYACSEVSSDGSKWKKALHKPDATSLSAKGVLANDISYAHATTPGVCVLKVMSLPKVPPAAGQEFIVDSLKRSIRRMERKDIRARRAHEDHKKFLAHPEKHGGDVGSASEVLPKQQRMSAGKPKICRPIDGTHEAVKEMFEAEDSHFTSEYRANGFWKATQNMQELKEHVRPYDSWTLFRDSAAKGNSCCRFPINTY